MKPYFVFLDESGSLNDKRERFFALGLLKMQDTHLLTEAVYRVNQQLVSDKRWRWHEFKFNDLRAETLPYYIALVDSLLDLHQYYFCAFVVDKRNPLVDWQGKFDTVWEAYIVYSRLLVTHCLASADCAIVLADYLGKPKKSAKYYELEVLKPVRAAGTPGCVLNAAMIDSKASPLVQVVDVLLGAVRYEYLCTREPAGERKAAKLELCNHLRQRLGWRTLVGDQVNAVPQCFRVWEFQPKG